MTMTTFARSAALTFVLSFTLLAAATSHAPAQDATQTVKAPNWCKGRAQSDCTGAVACSWRETITDGVSKTSCVYNAKAAKLLLAKSLGISN